MGAPRGAHVVAKGSRSVSPCAQGALHARNPRATRHPPAALCVHPGDPRPALSDLPRAPPAPSRSPVRSPPIPSFTPGSPGHPRPRLPGWAMEAGTQPRQPHTWAQQRLNAALPGALPGLKPVSRCWPRPVSRAAAPLCAVWCCARARLRAPAAAPTGPTLSLPRVPRCPCGAGLCAARGASCSPRWTALLETLPSPLAPTHAVPWSQLTDVLEPSGTDLERGTLCPHRSCDRPLDECRPPAPPPRPRPCPAYPACLPEQDVHVFFLLDSRF